MEILAGQSKAGPRPKRTRRDPQVKNRPGADSRGPQVNDSITISGALVAAGGTAAISLTDLTKIDKFKHMGVTAAATVALGTVGFSPAASATLAWVGGTVGKEIVYDLVLGRGTASVHDAVANLAGAFAGYAALKGTKGMGGEVEQNLPSLDPARQVQPHGSWLFSSADNPGTSPEK